MYFANLHLLDWIVLLVYMLLVLSIGFFFTKKAGKGLAGFFLSNRSLPWWLAGTSVVAGHYGAAKPIQIVQMVREYGIAHVWLFWYMMPATIIGAVFVVKLWRRMRIITSIELIRVRYSGAGVHILTLWQVLFEGIIMRSMFIGINLIALQKVIEVLLPGFPPVYIIIGLCVVALVYTAASGLYAVVVTDFIQFIFGAIGSLVIVIAIYAHFGSPAALVESVVAAGKENLVHMVPKMPEAAATITEKLNYLDFLLYIFVLWCFHGWLIGGGSNPQRLMAVKNERHASLQCLWADVIDFGLLFWLLIIVALGSVTMLPSDIDHEHAYIAMGITYLPVVVKGVFIASMFAALMSTIDTNLNLSAGFLTNDIYKNYFVKKASDKHYLLIARLSTLGMMALGLLMWYLMRQSTLLNNLKLVMMLIAGGGLVQFFSFFWWRINAWSVAGGMISSVIITSFVKWGLPHLHPFFQNHNVTTDHYPIGLLMIVLSTTSFWVIISLITHPTRMENLKDFFTRARPMGLWGPVKKALGPNIKGDKVQKHEVVAALGAAITVFGFIFGLGNLLLGSYLTGIGIFAFAAVGLKIYLLNMSKNEWWHRDIDAIRAAEEQSSAEEQS